VPEPRKIRTNSRGNLKGLLIFPNQPSNYQKNEKYSLIHMSRKSIPTKTPPKKDSVIFPVDKSPRDEQQRTPFTARMPGENLNSLQFISSENIHASVDREDETPKKVPKEGR